MQKWFVFSFAALALTSALVSAQVVQVQPAKPAQIQVEVQPNVELARAIAMPGPGFGARTFGQADAVVVGRVIALEPMDVEATPSANQPKVNYRIAVIQVTEAIHGVKKGTETIRVGFIVGGANVPGGNNGGPIQILPAIQPVPPNQIQPIGRPGFRPGFGQLNLTVGQDGIFTLTKHHKENFYLAPAYNNFVNRQNNNNFDNDVKTAKQLAKVMGDTTAALKGEDQQDRFLAAALLISKYRSNPTGVAMRQEPIDAAESKLILKALAQGDWKVGQFNAAIPSAYELFNQLGVTAKDGYAPTNIRTQQDIAQAMQKWLSENGEKYVIQKLVADPNAKGPAIQPGIDPVPLPVNPKVRPPIKVQPGKAIPIKKAIQVLPAPVPAPQPVPAPVQIELPATPAVPAPAPANRRE